VYRPLTKTTPSEEKIVSKSVKAIRKAYPDAFVFKVHGGMYQRSGVPDLYIGVGGKSIWIEMKRPGADTTELQKFTMEQLKRQGIPCGTAESPERVLEIIKIVLAFG
jgi:hypothetical protein